MPAVPIRTSAGAQIVNAVGDVGTFGLRVLSSGADYALTCGHVVAPPSIQDPRGEAIQCADGLFGQVADWTPFTNSYNTTDAALIKPALPNWVSNEPLNLSADPKWMRTLDEFNAFMHAPDQDWNVEIWSNRLPGGEPIRGSIEDVFVQSDNKKFAFDPSGTREYFFAPILGYRAPVVLGDSGAAVVHTKSRTVLGLHFAIDTNSGLGFCILFPCILDSFSTYKLTVPG